MGPRGFSPQRGFLPPPGSLPENEHPQHGERTHLRTIKPFTGEEVKANRIKLSPEKITAWWHMLRAFLIARVPELRVILSDDEATWERCKSQTEMIAANEWLATQLFTILQAEGCIANQNFLADVRDSNAGALSNGRLLAKLILAERYLIPPGLELVRQEKFCGLLPSKRYSGTSCRGP